MNEDKSKEGENRDEGPKLSTEGISKKLEELIDRMKAENRALEKLLQKLKS